MKVIADLAYAERSGLPLDLDLLVPAEAEQRPLVLFVHGGGWISGDKTMYAEEAEWLAEQGYASACVSYRLAPLATFPAPIADLQDAVQFLRKVARDHGAGNGKIISIGNSAGGHLSAMLGLCDTYYGTGEPDKFKVDAVVSICGITDMRNVRECHLPISWSFLEQFLGTLDDDTLCAAASPITHVSQVDAPFLLIHGDQDDVVPVQQSVALAESLREAGVEVQLEIMRNEFHSFSFDGWMRIRELYLAFLKQWSAVGGRTS